MVFPRLDNFMRTILKTKVIGLDTKVRSFLIKRISFPQDVFNFFRVRLIARKGGTVGIMKNPFGDGIDRGLQPNNKSITA